MVKNPDAPQMLSVYLDYDVWIGEERVKCDPSTAVSIPRDLAIRMLKEGKARRADPLPE